MTFMGVSSSAKALIFIRAMQQCDVLTSEELEDLAKVKIINNKVYF